MDSDEGPASGVGSKWKSGGFGMGHHLTILRWGFILQIHASSPVFLMMYSAYT